MTDDARPQQVPAAEVPEDVVLVDVREPDEWTAGHAPGAVHIPLGQLGDRYTEIRAAMAPCTSSAGRAVVPTGPRTRWPGRAGTW